MTSIPSMLSSPNSSGPFVLLLPADEDTMEGEVFQELLLIPPLLPLLKTGVISPSPLPLR